MDRQRIIIFDGPDMCGKTSIAQELARRTGIPYFKASSEHGTFLTDQDAFLQQLRHADPRVLDFLKQTGSSVIFDRAYPSEWVYSKLLQRTTDGDVLVDLDDGYYELGADLVICLRKSYVGIVDDIQPKFTQDVLEKQDRLYQGFLYWTKLRSKVVYTDDRDLDRQVGEILGFVR